MPGSRRTSHARAKSVGWKGKASLLIHVLRRESTFSIGVEDKFQADVCGERAAEEVTLESIAAQGGEALELHRVLDAFDHQGKMERPAKIGDAFDDMFVHAAGADIRQRSIDLHGVERQFAQIVQ